MSAPRLVRNYCAGCNRAAGAMVWKCSRHQDIRLGTDEILIMSCSTTGFQDAAWDEATIHEFLGRDNAHPLKDTKPDALDLETRSNSTESSDTRPKHKKTHRKLSAKDRTIKSSAKVIFRTERTGVDQTATIRQLDEVLHREEKADCGQWPTPIEESGEGNPCAEKKGQFGSYSLQQKKEILSQLQGRVQVIEASIAAARSALEQLSQFM